jgi:phosphoesterase RecJ-like protein
MDYPIQDIVDALKVPAYVTIVSHRNPDGDAIGSCMALYHMLNTFGHTVRVVMPSEYPAVFEWIADIDQVVIYDLDTERAVDCIEKAEIIMALDFNSLDRIDKMGLLIHELDKRVIMIDHHIDPEPIGEIMMSDTEASSTVELIYKLIEQAGWMKRFNMDMAECVYTGLITDTGSFRHATNPDVYRIAGELKNMGLDDYGVQERIFDNMTEKQLRLLGHCLANRMEILAEQQTGIIALTKQDYLNFNIQRGDTEGIVNYLLKIPGIKVAAFITEQPKLVKLSLRSKGDISVQQIASENFNGGGHYNASGGYSYKRLTSVVNTFKNILPKYINNYNEIIK